MNELDIVRIDGWPIAKAGFDDGVPRIRDVDLAERLGYGRPADIRELVRRLIASKKLNEIALIRTVRKSGGRPAEEFWLTEEQALFVAARSETPRAVLILKAIIDVFMAARRDAENKKREVNFLERRVLQFEQRNSWSRLWDDQVVKEICRLHRWPTSNAKGGMYAPLASVFDRVYRILLGDETVDLIKLRNPKPAKGNNHHQLLHEEVRRMVGGDVQMLIIYARQSATAKQWFSKLRTHFRHAAYQLEFS